MTLDSAMLFRKRVVLFCLCREVSFPVFLLRGSTGEQRCLLWAVLGGAITHQGWGGTFSRRFSPQTPSSSRG